MINLIPNEEKHKKVKDFYFRLTVVTLFILGLSFFIAAAAILPAYLTSEVKKNLAETRLETQNMEPVPLSAPETQKVVEGLDSRLSLIESAEKNKYLVSLRVVNAIMQKKLPSVKITRMSYETDAKGKKASIRGTARSREELLLFRRALEDDSAWKSVDLPISNFVKGSNIEFTLNLVPS